MNVPLLSSIGLSILTASLLWFNLRHDTVKTFLRTLPLAGTSGKKWTDQLKGLLRSIVNTNEMVDQGYEAHTSKGNPFVLPNLGSDSIIILPPSQLHMLNKPNRQVDAWEFQMDTWQPYYTMGDEGYYETAIQMAFAVVRKKMSLKYRDYAEVVVSEFDAAFTKHWGRSSQFSSVNIHKSITQMMAQISARTFFGLPVCHEEELQRESYNFGNGVFMRGAHISLLPAALRPLLGHFIARPARLALKRCKVHMNPVVEQRLKQYLGGEECPEDILQWIIQEYHSSAAQRMDPDHITQSLLILAMQTIFGVAFTLTDCILDLYSSKDVDVYIEGLREEAARVLCDDNDSTLSLGDRALRLNRADSVVRESMRHSGFHSVSLIRTIAAHDGLKLNDATTIPHGALIAFPQQAIHFDESYYANARQFDAFRFSRPYESASTGSSAPLASGTAQSADQQEVSTLVSTRYLSWGYGPHACPARAFSAQTMRLMLAYIVKNYDIESLSERKRPKAMMNVQPPSADAMVRVRWRGGE